MEDAKGFVTGVKKGDWISLFVATLQGVDFSRVKYPDPLNPLPPMEEESQEIQDHFADKTNVICGALREVMMGMMTEERREYLNPILSTYAKVKLDEDRRTGGTKRRS